MVYAISKRVPRVSRAILHTYRFYRAVDCPQTVGGLACRAAARRSCVDRTSGRPRVRCGVTRVVLFGLRTSMFPGSCTTLPAASAQRAHTTCMHRLLARRAPTRAAPSPRNAQACSVALRNRAPHTPRPRRPFPTNIPLSLFRSIARASVRMRMTAADRYPGAGRRSPPGRAGAPAAAAPTCRAGRAGTRRRGSTCAADRWCAWARGR